MAAHPAAGAAALGVGLLLGLSGRRRPATVALVAWALAFGLSQIARAWVGPVPWLQWLDVAALAAFVAATILVPVPLRGLHVGIIAGVAFSLCVAALIFTPFTVAARWAELAALSLGLALAGMAWWRAPTRGLRVSHASMTLAGVAFLFARATSLSNDAWGGSSAGAQLVEGAVAIAFPLALAWVVLVGNVAEVPRASRDAARLAAAIAGAGAAFALGDLVMRNDTVPPTVRMVVASALALAAIAPAASTGAWVLEKAHARSRGRSRSPGRRLAQLRPGEEILPGVVVERAIGEGSQADVYRARAHAWDTRVVVKVRKVGPGAIAQAWREVDALRRVRHPNVVRLLDAHERDDQVILVLEDLGGLPVSARLDGQTMAPKGVLRLARDSTAGLQALHARGLIHRDIKPENILEAEDGRFVILDLGSCTKMGKTRTVSGLDAFDALVGTPEYMAPEQAAGRPVDVTGDLYSLGLVLYEALVGKPARPTGGQPLKQLLANAAGGRVDLTLVPSLWRALLARALEREPSARFGSALEMLRAIEALSSLVDKDASTHGQQGASLQWDRAPALHRLPVDHRPVAAPEIAKRVAPVGAALDDRVLGGQVGVVVQPNLTLGGASDSPRVPRRTLESIPDAVVAAVSHENSRRRRNPRVRRCQTVDGGTGDRGRLKRAQLGERPNLVDDGKQSLVTEDELLAASRALVPKPLDEPRTVELLEMMRDRLARERSVGRLSLSGQGWGDTNRIEFMRRAKNVE